MTAGTPPPTDGQYQVLFTFRRALRQFLRSSEQAARREGLTHQQEELLLCVRGHPAEADPRISDLAADLMIRIHSAVGLVNRTEAMGLLVRRPDPVDQRVVRVSLTPRGHEVLDRLTLAQLRELEGIAAKMHVSEEFLTALAEEFLGNGGVRMSGTPAQSNPGTDLRVRD